MPGRRYGGFLVGDKYVHVSRRHQAPPVYNSDLGIGGSLVGIGFALIILWFIVSLLSN